MTDEPTTPSERLADARADSWRGVSLHRIGQGRFMATNERGGVLPLGSGGEDPDFTPVEAFLAALAGCGAVNVDSLTSRRAEPIGFDVRAEGHKARDEIGTHLSRLRVTFQVDFPAGEDGDRAREMLPRAVQQVQDRLCTVSHTVHRGERVAYVVADED